MLNNNHQTLSIFLAIAMAKSATSMSTILQSLRGHQGRGRHLELPQCRPVRKQTGCGDGCYPDPDGNFEAARPDDRISCIHVPDGYESREGENQKFDCYRNWYSNADTGLICRPCPAGTYTPVSGSAVCLPCSSGTFKERPFLDCTECNPFYYNGPGSTIGRKQDGIVYCLDPNNTDIPFTTTAFPSQEQQTSIPSVLPTTNPSALPLRSDQPTAAPSSTLTSIAMPLPRPTFEPTPTESADTTMPSSHCSLGATMRFISFSWTWLVLGCFWWQ